MMNLDSEGRVFLDRFLIADVVMKADFPAERWFWFDPPFHPGQSVLLHRQADNVYRIDFQLGWQADPEEEKKPEKVIPRIKAMLGADREFELEWVTASSGRSSTAFNPPLSTARLTASAESDTTRPPPQLPQRTPPASIAQKRGPPSSPQSTQRSSSGARPSTARSFR